MAGELKGRAPDAWSRRWVSGPMRAVGLLALMAFLLPATASAQSPPLSSTLRYGTGYLDVPTAAVLPNLALRAHFSTFWTSVDSDPIIDANGDVVGPGSGRSGMSGDAAFSVGLLDRLEVGSTVQSFQPEVEGGHLLGFFGRALLLDPAASGLGLAVGARYLRPPDFEDGLERAPTRLGFQDSRARARFADGRELNTEWTLYGVSTLVLPGVAFPWLPDNDVTLTAGWGTGMFQEGGDLAWYADGDLGGWFFGAGWDVQLGPRRLVTLHAEHNGLDVNAGAEVTWGDVRLGAHALGLNHGDGSSAYRSRKLGLSITLTACPLLNRKCEPRIRTRTPPDTVRLPAPPPDTVAVARPLLPPGSSGRPQQLCLSTGEDEWVLVTALGDTLVGPERRSLRALPPGAGLPGRYAEGEAGFDAEATLEVEGVRYAPVGEPETPACAALVPWSEWNGVPVFRLREGGDPPEHVVLPLRPGVWQRYRTLS